MLRCALTLALVLGASGPALANDWDDCNSRTVERSIRGCTRIINTRSTKRTDLAAAYASRAVAHMDNSDWPAARLDADKAIETDGRSGLGWAVRGHLQNRDRSYKAALASFEKAISATPRDPGAWEGRSVARLQTGDLDGALSDANRALQIDPKITVVYIVRARVRLERNQLAQAFPDIERALALDAKNSEAYYFRAQANRKAGELAKALKDAEKAVEHAPADAEALVLRGLLRGENGKPKDGLADVDRAIGIEPDSGDAHGAKALLAMAIEDLDTALRHANRAVELKDSQGHEIRGLVYLRLGEHGHAVDDLTRHIKDKSDTGLNALVARGQAYAMRGQRNEAIADLEAAIKLTPWLPRERQSHALAKEKLPEIKGTSPAAATSAPSAPAQPPTSPNPPPPTRDLTAQPSASGASTAGGLPVNAANVQGQRTGNWTVEAHDTTCAIRLDIAPRSLTLRRLEGQQAAVIVSSPAWPLRTADDSRISGLAVSLDGKARTVPLSAASIHPRPGAARNEGDLLLRVSLDTAKSMLEGRSLRVTVNGRTELFDVSGAAVPLVRLMACAALSLNSSGQGKPEPDRGTAVLEPHPDLRPVGGWTVLGHASTGFCVLRQILPQGLVEYRRLADGTLVWTWQDDRHERQRGAPGQAREVEVVFDDMAARIWSWQAASGGRLTVAVPQDWLMTTLPRFERITLRAGGASASYRYTGFSQGYAALGPCTR